MNTSVDSTIQQNNNIGKTSTLGQLGQAIRRSMIYFVIATIVLVIAYVLLIEKENEIEDIFTQTLSANAVEVDVYEMRDNERTLQLTSNESTVLKYEEKYKHAIEKITEMLASPNITAGEKKEIERVQKNINIYKKLFDDAVTANRNRGFTDVSGAKGALRTAALNINAELNNMTNDPVVEAALLKVRGISKDFVILERPAFVPAYNQAIEEFRQAVRQSETMSLSNQESLIKYSHDYQDAFNLYAENTALANVAFADSTVALHATISPLPRLVTELEIREKEAFKQIYIILIATAVILIGIFLLVVYQLRKAQTSANQTLEDTIAAQKAAEDENERLNDSVINILETVNALSQRDLTAKAPVTEDVIGTVSDSINALTDETAKVLHNVTGIAGRVSLVSDNVRDQATQVSETAKAEQESVQKMFESLFEATQTMNQVAALAEQSNESAEQATEVTANALQTVNTTVGGMESIRETISETEKRIKRLGERSQEISGIVNLINTISERTHVLALNASMQAAVAGEAGRGFAVVAEEVQQLAESSRNATEQIATLVNNIQLETNETINTVNRTIGQVVEGSEQAQQAGQQMRETQAITAELVARVQSIAQASQKQKEMSAQLLEAVQDIGESNEKTAEQIAAQNAGTEELQEAAKTLVSSVSVFKLPQQS